MASIEVREGRSGVSFRVSWRLEDGRQQSRSFRSRAEAKAFRSELEGARARGVIPDLSAGAIPLAEWSEDVLGMLFLKPKTRENYRSLLRSRILPTFGHRKLSTISRREIQAWVSEMALEVSAQRARAPSSSLRKAFASARDLNDFDCCRPSSSRHDTRNETPERPSRISMLATICLLTQLPNCCQKEKDNQNLGSYSALQP